MSDDSRITLALRSETLRLKPGEDEFNDSDKPNNIWYKDHSNTQLLVRTEYHLTVLLQPLHHISNRRTFKEKRALDFQPKLSSEFL